MKNRVYNKSWYEGVWSLCFCVEQQELWKMSKLDELLFESDDALYTFKSKKTKEKHSMVIQSSHYILITLILC